MRKFLPYILILIIVVGVFSPFKKTESANEPACQFDPRSGLVTNTPCISAAGMIVTNNTFVAGVPGSADDIKKDQTKASAGDSSCGLFNLTQCAMNVVTTLVFAVLGLVSLVLWMAGTLLDMVLNFTVVNMAINIKQMTGINIAWKIIRDLMNIAFIFLLVYEGIKIIIGLSDVGKVKTFISGVVLASLLINFSLFFTKVLIDASNIVTIGIYKSIIADTTVQNSAATNVSGLSVPFMNALGVTSFFSPTTFETIVASAGGDTNLWIIALIGSVVLLIVSFVFFAVSVMFIVRYITLIVLLMLSPIAYMGMAIPQLKSYANDWWKSLNGQLIFAPVFMVMTLVTLTLMASPGFITTTGNWGDLITNQGQAGNVTANSNGSISLIFNFAVIIGLIIASLVVAKKTSKEGSSYIGTTTSALTKFAGDRIMGGGGWVGRNTVGSLGASRADNAQLQEDATKKGFAGAWARTKLYTARQARDATFDVRNASVPTSAIGDIVKGTAGRTTFGKKLGLNDVEIPNISVGAPMAKMSGVGSAETKGYRDKKEESAKRVRAAETASATELAAAISQRDILRGGNVDSSTPEGKEAIDKMETALAKMSDKQTETLVAGNRELLDSQEFANKISVKQLEAIIKSDQFSDDDKDKIKNNRFAEIGAVNDKVGIDAIKKADEGGVLNDDEKKAADRVKKARGRIKGLSDSEVEMLDPKYLTTSEFVAELRPAQVESITKSSKFTSKQKKDLKDTRLEPLFNALNKKAGETGSPGSAVKPDDKLVRNMITKGLSIKDTAGLMGTKITFNDPAGNEVTESVLTHPDVMKLYSQNMLKRMGQEMSSGDIQTLRDAIKKAGELPGADEKVQKLAEWLDKDDGVNNFS